MTDQCEMDNKCNICFDNSVDEINLCPNCVCKMCNECYDSYVNTYNNTTCPMCKMEIVEINYNNQNSSDVAIEIGNTNLQNKITFNEKISIFFSFCVLNLLAYFIGLKITNLKGYIYILLNILYGYLVILSGLIILYTLIVNIFRNW